MKLPGIFVVLLFMAACDAEVRVNNAESDIAAIEKVVRDMTAAYKARDWDEFTGYFTDNGIWMPPGQTSLQGKDEWWEFASGFWESSTVLDIGVTTHEILVAGDLAIERHSEFQTMLIGEEPEPITMYFKGVWIFHRHADGSWKIARYIWNEDAGPNDE